MRKLILTAILLLALTVSGAAGNSSSAWNNHAAEFHFRVYPQSMSATFGSSYEGSNFAGDFAGIKAAVADEVQGTIPPWNDDDLFNASIDNWP